VSAAAAAATALAVALAFAGGTATPASPVPAASRQMVLSVSAGWEATRALVQAYERPAVDAPWAPVGPAVEAALGRTGLGWGRGLHPPVAEGAQKREGDGRSPAGVFDLRLATGYEAKAPGTRLAYRIATPTLRCVDDPRSRFYNQIVDESAVAKDWASAEDMRRRDEQYRVVVWVGHDDAPAVPGAGSCIFSHQRPGPAAVTSGCTALDAAPLDRLLAWLDPAARPVLVQLPEREYRARAAAWGLPAKYGRPQGSTAER
jgi:L,D-peptidoglycan transpeptidase YkuD (ErfK/YbiS/YcfS/YnhG family)